MKVEQGLREALSGARATEERKTRTLAYLARQTEKRAGSAHPRRLRRWALAACALALAVGLMFGRWVYFTPASAICIQGGPLLELQVNRFGLVIGQTGGNALGEALAQELNLRFLDYTGAVERLLEEGEIAELLERGGKMSIQVVCDDDERKEEMVAGLKRCTRGRHNVRCHGGGASGEGGHHGKHHRWGHSGWDGDGTE